MRKTKIKLAFSSHLGKPLNDKFAEHVLKTVGVPCDVVCYENYNQYSLSQIYNKALDEFAPDDETIIVFCHNDIEFKTNDWGKRLLGTFNNSEFDIIGMAGSTFMPASGRWWDLPHKMIGIVEHTNGLRNWTSYYSPKEYVGAKECVIIDGLFIAFNPKTIKHKFDEEFDGFHFYDLGFSFPNYLDGCNVGVVTNIRILHHSVGMTNEKWEMSRLKFVEKYKEDLPADLI